MTDPAWVHEYLSRVNDIVADHGGRYLARTSQFDMLEGDDNRHQTAIVMEFSSREAAYGFYNSEEYAPLRDARIADSTGKLYIVAGEDSARG